MTVPLPPVPAAFFAADKAGDVNALADLFTTEAVVVDERRAHVGRAAIRAWKAETATLYSYTAEPVALHEHDGRTIVIAHLSGDFPGSPIDLRYAFTLEGGSIARLEIAP